MIDFLTSAIDTALQHNFIELENYSFRGSQLPYCSVRDFISSCQTVTKELPKRLVPFRLLNSADIGTTMHRIIQQALAEKNLLYGNWKCGKCKQTVEKSLPLTCCGKVMEYREFHVEDAITGFSGHADAVVPYGAAYLLVDFKTKAPNKLKSVQLTDGYRLQVAAYRYHLMRPPYNIPIVGSAIVYLSREDRPNFKIVEIPPDDLADLEFDRFRRQRISTVEILQTGETQNLKKLCNKHSDQPYCPYNYRCFGYDPSVFPTYLKTEWEKSKSAQITDQGPKEGQ